MAADLAARTIAATNGVAQDTAFGAVIAPIHLSTTFKFPAFEQPGPYDYSRLGNPTRDPHGDPIPTRDGHLDKLGDIPLDRVPEGAAGVVTRVSDRDNTVLRHLAEIGLWPDSPVEVVSRQVELGIITVSLDGRVVPVGTPVAAAVRVRVLTGDDDEVGPDQR